jgi:hypothetical protein
VDGRDKPGHDEEEAAVPLLECRGRKQAIANRHVTAPRSLEVFRDRPDQHEDK